MEWSAADYRFMARAIRLAERASCHVHPNPKVGCVLVKNGAEIAQGWHHRAGEDHAEIVALNQVSDQARGSTCYVTLEPCAHTGKTPPCADALIHAGIKEVVIAGADPNPEVNGSGIARLEQAGVNVRTGLLASEAGKLNPGFLSRMQRQRPYVRCKLAMTLDARTALAGGDSHWITSESARRDVHKLRAQSSAILTGIQTVLSDDPAMTVRQFDSDDYQPLRVILDSRLRVPVDARILQQPGHVLVFTLNDNVEESSQLQSDNVEIIHATGTDGRIDLGDMLQTLANQYAVNDLLLESGSVLAGAMLQAQLVDELVVYIAPKLFGHTARSLLELPELLSIEEASTLTVVDIRQLGDNVKITARLNTRK